MTKYVNGKPILDRTVIIKSNVPIPEERSEKNREIYEAAKTMKIGQCFDIPYTRTGISGNLSRATGHTFIQRKLGKILRIWRIK